MLHSGVLFAPGFSTAGATCHMPRGTTKAEAGFGEENEPSKTRKTTHPPGKFDTSEFSPERGVFSLATFFDMCAPLQAWFGENRL